MTGGIDNYCGKEVTSKRTWLITNIITDNRRIKMSGKIRHRTRKKI